MRFMLEVCMPNDKFNRHVQDGSVGSRMNKILEETRPEHVFFTEKNGERTALLIVDLADASKIPFYAEPWFLNFDAKCNYRICMTPKDLQNSGLEELGKKWSK